MLPCTLLCVSFFQSPWRGFRWSQFYQCHALDRPIHALNMEQHSEQRPDVIIDSSRVNLSATHWSPPDMLWTCFELGTAPEIHRGSNNLHIANWTGREFALNIFSSQRRAVEVIRATRDCCSRNFSSEGEFRRWKGARVPLSFLEFHGLDGPHLFFATQWC